ncbi:hypothetical protein L249_8065 [Ophiocordyceps polyrhachis-furcata BCC 54312]|uniref:RanBD1 domain-containing protein n=1 Tax=Ophiocordyceps polyrhachis-furcata BCC 54312 TaxID=1330021 RepID=A0A367LHD5_9HYPO|nr:hypothetical protein L249_8065 [Ophiocordyceps polyrhachis-furcata BCC 54312]
MSDDNQRASSKNEPALCTDSGEDAEMRAARRELKQSSISDPSPLTRNSGDNSTADSKADAASIVMPSESPLETTHTGNATESNTVESKANASPKKKRAHDQLDADRKTQHDDAASVASSDSAKDRSSRLEPEKKRHRDQEYTDLNLKTAEADSRSMAREEEVDPKSSSDKTTAAASDAPKVPSTSLPAAPGASSKSVAGSSANFESSSLIPAHPSTASVATAAVPAPKLTFGRNDGVSPFAALSSTTNGFAARSGQGFASAFSAMKPLNSFAALGAPSLQGGKAKKKPFGAPDSESEPDDEGEQTEPDRHSEELPRALSPDKDSDDRKKTRLQKGISHQTTRHSAMLTSAVEVDDGEAGEVTIVSVRAKMFSLDKDAGWKERGAGMLKINVPRVCVEFDETGAPVPGSFDASVLVGDEKASDDGKGHQVARLIMRQDQTLRVILNTVIIPTMLFQQKATLKSVGVLFTAFEGEEVKPVSITMRMSAANAKIFMKDVEMVQRQLRRM